ncbi:hypothetical protein KC951_00240 [Candidatus Saccharibacteria bacterium]|nr:hypothetical protein [Candidatus Saccharibacteria bacterium]
MFTKKPKWNSQQIAWYTIGLLSVIFSLLIYWDWIKALFIKPELFCNLNSYENFLRSLAEPKIWFATFTLIILLIAARHLAKTLASKFPLVEQLKWLVLAVALMLTTLLLATRC